MKYTPRGTITLYKYQYADPTNAYNLDFASSLARESYFSSLARIIVDNYAYIRKDGTIKVPYDKEDLIGYNYLSFRNDSGRIFYAFISAKTYVNDSVTTINFTIDYFMTFLSDRSNYPLDILRGTLERGFIDRWVKTTQQEETFYIPNKVVLRTPIEKGDYPREIIETKTLRQATSGATLKDDEDEYYSTLIKGWAVLILKTDIYTAFGISGLSDTNYAMTYGRGLLHGLYYVYVVPMVEDVNYIYQWEGWSSGAPTTTRKIISARELLTKVSSSDAVMSLHYYRYLPFNITYYGANPTESTIPANSISFTSGSDTGLHLIKIGTDASEANIYVINVAQASSNIYASNPIEAYADIDLKKTRDDLLAREGKDPSYELETKLLDAPYTRRYLNVSGEALDFTYDETLSSYSILDEGVVPSFYFKVAYTFGVQYQEAITLDNGAYENNRGYNRINKRLDSNLKELPTYSSAWDDYVKYQREATYLNKATSDISSFMGLIDSVASSKSYASASMSAVSYVNSQTNADDMLRINEENLKKQGTSQSGGSSVAVMDLALYDGRLQVVKERVMTPYLNKALDYFHYVGYELNKTIKNMTEFKSYMTNRYNFNYVKYIGIKLLSNEIDEDDIISIEERLTNGAHFIHVNDNVVPDIHKENLETTIKEG